MKFIKQFKYQLKIKDSHLAGVEGSDTDEIVVETGVTIAGPALCWSFCCAAFFFRLSL